MDIGITLFRKNTAVLAIVIIDLMFMVWSCENESGKLAKHPNEMNKKEIVDIAYPQDHLI